MFKKFTSTLAGASLFIAAFGIISKGVGFLREILFASLYGLSIEFDIYLIGAIIPLIINTIILSLGQNYIIPKYNELRSKDDISSLQFIQPAFYLFLSVGIILSLTLYLLSDLIISSFILHDFSLTEIASTIFNLFLITVPITCCTSVLIAYQQANFEFRFPVISNLLLNFMVLIIVFTIRGLNTYAIPIGYIIGSFLQLFYLIYKSKEIFIFQEGFLKSLKQLGKLASSTLVVIILIESIGQLYVLSDRLFYSQVTSGGISALNYALTIYMLPIAIISSAVSTVIFPKFSEFHSKRIFSNLDKILNEALIVNVLIFTPIMLLFIYHGDFILKIIFERGKFSESDTILTSNVLLYYSLSIIIYAAYFILNKIIYSAGLIKKLLFITIVGILIKIILNYLFVRNMEQDGLALSTSISFIFFFIASFFIVYNKFGFQSRIFFFNELIFHLLIGIFSIYFSKQISSLLYLRTVV